MSNQHIQIVNKYLDLSVLANFSSAREAGTETINASGEEAATIGDATAIPLTSNAQDLLEWSDFLRHLGTSSNDNEEAAVIEEVFGSSSYEQSALFSELLFLQPEKLHAAHDDRTAADAFRRNDTTGHSQALSASELMTAALPATSNFQLVDASLDSLPATQAVNPAAIGGDSSQQTGTPRLGIESASTAQQQRGSQGAGVGVAVSGIYGAAAEADADAILTIDAGAKGETTAAQRYLTRGVGVAVSGIYGADAADADADAADADADAVYNVDADAKGGAAAELQHGSQGGGGGAAVVDSDAADADDADAVTYDAADADDADAVTYDAADADDADADATYDAADANGDTTAEQQHGSLVAGVGAAVGAAVGTGLTITELLQQRERHRSQAGASGSTDGAGAASATSSQRNSAPCNSGSGSISGSPQQYRNNFLTEGLEASKAGKRKLSEQEIQEIRERGKERAKIMKACGSFPGSTTPTTPYSHFPASTTPTTPCSHSPASATATTPYSHSPASTTPYSHSPASTTPYSHSPASTTPYSHSPASTTPYSHSPASTTPTTPYSHSPASTTPTTPYSHSPASTTPTTPYSHSPASTTPTLPYSHSPASTTPPTHRTTTTPSTSAPAAPTAAESAASGPNASAADTSAAASTAPSQSDPNYKWYNNGNKVITPKGKAPFLRKYYRCSVRSCKATLRVDDVPERRPELVGEHNH
ncbi:unnamed protein product [Closterium sp. NIES-53]